MLLTHIFKRFHIFIVIGLLAFMPVSIMAQQESADIRSGNKYYKQEKYTEAEIEYRKGLDKNKDSFEGHFNLGDALYRQEKFDDAIEQFKIAGTQAEDDKGKLAAVNHNIGNALLQQQKYAESIAAYKQALKNNPKDDETRYNLAYAQEMLRQQQQQQQQNQNQDNKDDNKQDEQKQNQQQEQNKQEQEQQDQEQQQPQPQEQTMSKENAEQILEALLQDEKETQEKAKRATMKSSKKADKDW